MTDEPATGRTSAGTASRNERSRVSQERILDAAVTALVESGYSGATTLRIQEIAEVTRGRLLHHFPSRDDLLVAAVAHLTEVRVAQLAIDEPWPSDAEARIDRIVERMWEAFDQPYFWASAELWMAARANPRLREALAPHERRVAAYIHEKMAEFFGPTLSRHPDYPVLRDLLITSMRGLALTYTFRTGDFASESFRADWKSISRRILLS